MIKFLLTYWIGIALFFGIFYWEFSPISPLINQLQTDLTTYLTSVTLPSEMMKSYHIIINKNYSLVIEKACNGIIPYLFFLASIVAFPSTIIHKIKWAIFGYLFITTMNTLRIWMVTQLVLEEQNYFSLAHDYLGNALLIATGLFLFVGFVKSRRRYSKART
jgi:exosortase/archaeosortase family protein